MFKDVTNLWSFLTFPRSLRVKQSPVAAYYLVAADLTNLYTILRRQCQTSLYFNCPPPTLEEYIIPRGDGADVDAPAALQLPQDLVEAEEEAIDELLGLAPRFHEPAIIPAEDMEEAMQGLLDAHEHEIEQLLDGFGALNLNQVWAAHQRHAEV